jgi:hypothetical protein
MLYGRVAQESGPARGLRAHLRRLGLSLVVLMQEMYFLFMAADPVDRYESFIYTNDHYSFQADRPAVDKFVESLDYRNSLEQRQRPPR